MSAEKLSGRQYTVTGRKPNGQPINMYISNEVTGKLHIRIDGTNIHFDEDRLYEILADMKGTFNCKHGGTF